MESHLIQVGNTIVTKPDSRGNICIGKVIKKNRVSCDVLDDRTNNLMGVPYSLIVGHDDRVEVVKIIRAVPGDIITDKQGETFVVEKVGRSRYVARSQQSQRQYYVPFTSVVKVEKP